MSEDSLPAPLLAVLGEVLRDRGGFERVEMLPLPRMVSDHCDKFIAFDGRGDPSAFIVVSPPAHPAVVSVACERAEAAKVALGAQLGGSVLVPWHAGDWNGVSYSITRYCRPVSTQRLMRRWQRLRMGPSALGWLADVARQTAEAPSEHDLAPLFTAPLQALAGHASVHPDLRSAAAGALQALAAGSWQPRSVVSHNDFWWGNLVLRANSGASANHAPGTNGQRHTPFYVIDWAGSTVRGHAIYDLVRLAMSMQLGRRRFKAELTKHAHILGCEPAHTVHHLMAALGTLSCNLGEWPVELFAQTAFNCHRALTMALR